MAASSAEQAAAVTVLGLSGQNFAIVSPVPENVLALKQAIQLHTGYPLALQRLTESNSDHVYSDTDLLMPESITVVMIVDETPLYTWDIVGNFCAKMLAGVGAEVSCPKLRSDYVNVITQEPIRSGTHYFQFVIHSIGDEQWCGLTQHASQAGCGQDCSLASSGTSGRSLKAWTYYSGSVHGAGPAIQEAFPDVPTRCLVLKHGQLFQGALHVHGRSVKKFQRLSPAGDVIGMLVCFQKGAVAFDLNGILQGACAIPNKPLWIITQLVRPGDHVALQKPCLQAAPMESVAALTGLLLDTSQGSLLGKRPVSPGSSDGDLVDDKLDDADESEPEV